jgi:hypothetical protein
MVGLHHTNNVTNYWTIALCDLAVNVIQSFSTYPGSTGAWHQNIFDTFLIDTRGAANFGLMLYCTKVGAPGNLAVVGPLLQIDAP